jgi:hypothetical protein
MDSTACLVGLDAAYFYVAFQLLPAGQYDMQEDNPITCHSERKMCLVAAGRDLVYLSKDRSHARMRHIRFYRDTRSRNWFRGRIGQPEGNHNGPNPSGFGRDFVLNSDRARLICWPGAG